MNFLCEIWQKFMDFKCENSQINSKSNRGHAGNSIHTCSEFGSENWNWNWNWIGVSIHTDITR